MMAVKQDVNGLLDLARTTFCEYVEQLEAEVKRVSSAHDVAMKLANSSKGFCIQMNNQRHYKVNINKLPEKLIRQLVDVNLVMSLVVHLDAESLAAVGELHGHVVCRGHALHLGLELLHVLAEGGPGQVQQPVHILLDRHHAAQPLLRGRG